MTQKEKFLSLSSESHQSRYQFVWDAEKILGGKIQVTTPKGCAMIANSEEEGMSLYMISGKPLSIIAKVQEEGSDV